MPIDEVVGTGTRIRDGGSSFATGVGSWNNFNVHLEQGSIPTATPAADADDSADDDDDDSILDEIVVTAAVPSVFVAPGTPFSALINKIAPSAFEKLIAGNVPTAFERLMAQPVKKRVLEEIVVKGTSTATRFNLLSFGAFLTGTLAAKIADEVSQQRLDRSFEELMAQGFRQPPDTPTRTIDPAQPMDEIIVRAPRLQTDMPGSPPNNPLMTFTINRPRATATRPALLTQPQLEPPEPPGTKPTRLKVPAQVSAPYLLTQTDPDPRLTVPKKVMLASPDSRFAPQTLTQPQTAAYCPPCKKGEETKKKRNECWRKLVKEARDPSNDKEYKWTRIDCDTGKEIPKIVQTIDKFIE